MVYICIYVWDYIVFFFNGIYDIYGIYIYIYMYVGIRDIDACKSASECSFSCGMK